LSIVRSDTQAGIAQLVEQRTENPRVTSSSLVPGNSIRRCQKFRSTQNKRILGFMKKSFAQSSSNLYTKGLSVTLCQEASNFFENDFKKILCTISGGQDSVLVFFFLLHVQQASDWTFSIVYCHHFWQVQNLYAFREIWKLSFLFKISGCFCFAHTNRYTEQESSAWRYSTYCRTGEFLQCDRITIAHTASDTIETAFWRLSRGTSPKGLIQFQAKKFSQLPSYRTKQRKRITFSIREAVFNPVEKKISWRASSMPPVYETINKSRQRVQWTQWSKKMFVCDVNQSTKVTPSQKFRRVLATVTLCCSPLSQRLSSRGLLAAGHRSPFCKQVDVQKKATTQIILGKYYPTYFSKGMPVFSRFRPLYNLHRSDVSFLVNQNNLPLLPDPTNENIGFTRNRIRLTLIPTIKLCTNNNFEYHFWLYLQMTSVQQFFLNSVVASILEGYCNTPPAIKTLSTLPAALEVECVYSLLQAFNARQISMTHVKKLYG
jgi:tRNA(Ile)-lysidine synthase TilS/MesJ